MKEVWKPIEGYGNYYEVSNKGRVKSWHNNRYGRSKKPKILSFSTLNHGHKSVTLSDDAERHYKLVHRLVAKAFIPNPKNKPQINHKDNNPANNHVVNLCWGTQSENIQQAFNDGRKSVLKGEEVKTSKLTREDVLDIRNAKRLGCFTNQELGDAFGVSPTCIFFIVHRKRWKHV